ncbi:phasin family protein [Sphingomonas sp. SUN019]|uniref:phasin family protein n=1 Tax=Sphingomonas sp. SUN019 TaxID=2937788 RepID=UPI002164BC7D|nr:phasin family protein [Sphingomonas sp. SUN019]UVO52035.1 phasin family protein [Sphingomonas sp. SUN019]
MADDTKSAINATAARTKAATDKAAGAAKDATDKMRAGAQRAQDTFREKVADPAKRAGEAMKESGKKVAEGSQTIGVKMIDQAEQNAREAFSAMRDAAKAKDLSEVMKIQGDYLREQTNRSMNQAREIGELIVQFGKDAVAPMRGGKG